jgi:D-glycero-D-manno-heptose 1,7-bisphosphate phosphatase
MGNPSPYRKRAVFLDRDGVINRNIWNPATREYEAPLTAEAFELLPGVPHGLAELQGAGFLLFVVSNQPNYAKGKSGIDAPVEIHRKLLALAADAGVLFAGCYYCFHHPDGSHADYAGTCLCRKPSPYLLLQAQSCFGLDLTRSWMIGDRESDIRCGKAAGARAILIEAPHSIHTGSEGVQQQCFSASVADAYAADLPSAVRIVLAASGSEP